MHVPWTGRLKSLSLPANSLPAWFKDQAIEEIQLWAFKGKTENQLRKEGARNGGVSLASQLIGNNLNPGLGRAYSW